MFQHATMKITYPNGTKVELSQSTFSIFPIKSSGKPPLSLGDGK